MSDYSLKNIMNKPERLAPGHQLLMPDIQDVAGQNPEDTSP